MEHVADRSNLQQLIYDARFDRTTQLPNELHLYEYLEDHFLPAVEASSSFGALFYIAYDDLYRFNHPSDPHRDEKILRRLAERIGSKMLENDFLSCVGREKLVFVRHGFEDTGAVRKTAEWLVHLNAEPVSIDDELIYITLSIGIAQSTFDTTSHALLVRLAENAMYTARASGWNRFSFFHSLPEECYEELDTIRKDLPYALEKGEVFFEYQPQYSLREKRYSGAELLVRWEHPRLGRISPDIFIPLAEQTGMIRILTMKALTEASRMFEQLSARGIDNFSLSVNLSPSALLHRDFLENIRFFLEHYALGGQQLHFEITESVLSHNMSEMAQTLSALRDMGIGIEIDDYGTGYTSLNYLLELPIDTIKIDRSFVTDIDTDTRKLAMFKAIVEMGRAMGYSIIAEGVENSDVDGIIRSLYPIRLQGWHYSRPLGEQALYTFLQQVGGNGPY